MTLDDHSKDEVIGMLAVKDATKESILVVSENGFGKRSSIEDYRMTNRGAKGVKTLNITDKTGVLVAIRSVTDEHDLMIINRSGVTIRVHARDISIIGRNTQGVRIINLEKRGDEIASVCRVLAEEELDHVGEHHQACEEELVRDPRLIEPVEEMIEERDDTDGLHFDEEIDN